MNALNAGFAGILQNMFASHGGDVWRDPRFANMLRDWTRNEFADESELFLLAVESGAAERIAKAGKMPPEAAWRIAARFSAECFIQEGKALEIVRLLVLLLRGKALSLPFTGNDRLYTMGREKRPPGKKPAENKTIAVKGVAFEKIDGRMIAVADGEYWRGERETITLSPYRITASPVNQHEYWSVTGDNPSYTVGAELPVEGVHWYAAVDFCNQKSIREGLAPCYAIDKTNPDENNQAPLDLYRWKVDLIPGADGWRLPAADEWEYAYYTSAAFAVNIGIKEWCQDFTDDLFGAVFYLNSRAGFYFDKRRPRRLEKLCRASAEGEGRCINVNKNRTNYGKACFSYAGNYGFRLARSGT